jgi:uncharacterized protein
MKVLLTGSSGLIGAALVSSLRAEGNTIARLVRSQTNLQPDDHYWNPDNGQLDSKELEGMDAVVHLAGETISERWTDRKKARIRNSRVQSTRLLSECLSWLKRPPRLMVSASAIGYYGDRANEVLREESAPGAGFLSVVCREWEAATEPAAQRGIRTVLLRTGVVLSSAGGALGQMLPPFRMGLGGKLGSGRQYMSWIAMDDFVGIVSHALSTPGLNGPVNAVAPNPVTNLEFTKALGRVLHRPTFFAMPAFVVRLVFGEMGQELLLGSAKVEPAKLGSSGYVFRYPEIEGALRHLLDKPI